MQQYIFLVLIFFNFKSFSSEKENNAPIKNNINQANQDQNAQESTEDDKTSDTPKMPAPPNTPIKNPLPINIDPNIPFLELSKNK